MKRLLLVLALVAAPLFLAPPAGAHTARATFSCTGVTFSFVRFRAVPGNTVQETVSIDGQQVASQTFSFDGPSGSNVVAITVPIGTHSVHAHAEWNTNHRVGSFDVTQIVSGCGNGVCADTSSIVSNFNGTKIAGDTTIWFNSVFKVDGVGSGPATVALHASTVTFSAGGVDYTVPIPDATITFSPSATQATTSYTGTNWSTVVPASFGDNVFLSGTGFVVPAAGLPGGINPVTWSGQFQTDTPGVSVDWQWGAAVYTSFSNDLNALGVKPLHSTTLDQYPNGDQAGTPENYKSFVTGGARGGGGANATGSYSATGHCP
jgi:hypothetical protein